MATITLPITCYVDKLLEIFAANEILEKTKHKFTIKFAKSSDFRGEVIVASNELISDIKLKYFNDKNVSNHHLLCFLIFHILREN